MRPDRVHVPDSFDVMLDGQTLNSDWKWEDTEIDRGEEKITVHIKLLHSLRPIRIHVVTVIDGTSALERRVDVEKLSDKPAALSAFAPLSGGVSIINKDRLHTAFPK